MSMLQQTVFDEFDDYIVKYGRWKMDQTHKRKVRIRPANGKLHVYI